jgi:hypothetical protein
VSFYVGRSLGSYSSNLGRKNAPLGLCGKYKFNKFYFGDW